jgi:hypothetical protein
MQGRWKLVGRAAVAVLVAGVFAAFGVGVAAASTYYSSVNGPILTTLGSTDCTHDNPCNIRSAINLVPNNSTIMVASGTYQLLGGTLTIPQGRKLDLDAQDPTQRPLIEANASNALIVLDVQDESSTVDGIDVWQQFTTQTVGGTLTKATAAYRTAGDTHHVFARSAPTGTGVVDGPACELVGHQSTPYFFDSICVSGAASAPGLRVALNADGTSTGTQYTVVHGDTLVSHSANGPGIEVDGNNAASDTHLAVLSTIATGNTDIVAKSSVVGAKEAVDVSYSNFDTHSETGTGATFSPGSGNQTAAPRFRDAPSYDYHEAPDSPTIGHGEALGDNTDIDGESRTLLHTDGSESADIGADQAPPPPPVTRYVSVDGKPTATCAANDRCDLRTAIATSLGVDEIVVGPGTYDLGSNGISVYGSHVHGEAGQPRPVIESSSRNDTLYVTDDADVSDLEFRDDNPLAYGISISSLAAPHLVERVVARGGDEGCDVAQAELRDSVCVATAYGTHGAGVYTGNGVTLRNVTAVGTDLSDGLFAQGLSSSPTLVTNVIARGGQSASDLVLYDDDVNVSHSSFVSFASAGGTLHDDGTNVRSAPLFANAAAFDFHEAAGSATIGAGSTDPENGPVDIDGDARAAGGRTDIGADQVPPAPVVVTPPGGTPGPDRTAPSFARLLLKPVRFVVLAKGQRPKRGVAYKTQVAFSLSEAAKVRAVVQVPATGRLVRGVCQKRTARNKKARSCKLWSTLGVAFSRSFAKAGRFQLAFAGKLGKRALKPGKYRLALTATDAAKNVSHPKTIAFQILKH